ncbi:MAG: hypothetical protein ACRD4K_08130 [Candidatus Acidiferrales bacterium]
METRYVNEALESAIDDLNGRSLECIETRFAKLVYLASTRDYNTGHYHHEGLARKFGEDIAENALAESHRRVFDTLALLPIETLVEELEKYIRSTRVPYEEVLDAWYNLEPYRVIVPAGYEPLLVETFVSDVRIALAILLTRQQRQSLAK